MPEHRRRARDVALVVVVAGLMVVPATSAHADAVTGESVRFEGGPQTTFELDDGRRFVDALELRPSGDGSLLLVNDVTMDDYLSGVAEMPPRWHGEALKAQAVAARTYAWRSIRRGTFDGRGYDICATVDCQVFAGADVVEGDPHGHRWREAVLETSGEVLLDRDGQPILARYFSTSGGMTVPNEVVFPESGSFEYLVGGEDPDDRASPLHRWSVELTREQFDDILSRGDTLSAAVPVAEVERRGELTDPRAEIVAVGEDGTEVGVPAVRFREFVSRVAADRYPDEFPGPREDGRGPLPATLPSSRFEVEIADDRVVIEGRGWGHGVGMGQYGAHGKAQRGMDYGEILASYYNGLTPEAPDGVPERVRVGLDVAADVEVRADGPVRVVAGDDEVAERGLGAWRVRAADGRVRLDPPAGRDEELQASPTALAPAVARAADRVVVEASVNKPVELALHVRDADGDTVLVRDLGVVDPGEHTATWRHLDADGGQVPDGTYHVALVATDEQGVEDGRPVAVEVTAPTDPDEGSALLVEEPRLTLAALALVVVAGAGATLALRRRSP